MGVFRNLLGTVLSTFGIGPKGNRATFDATALSGDRTLGIPDRAGILAVRGEPVTVDVAQAAHGFVVGTVVCKSGSSWLPADRDVTTRIALGIVSAVTDADNCTVALGGPVTLTTGEWDAVSGDTGGLVAGEFYCLASTAGQITATAPTSGIVQWLLCAADATTALVQIGDAFDKDSFTGGGGGGSGGGGYEEGTSFPGSPATDDKFYRTDLNLLCFYDGARWLTVQEYELAPQMQAGLLPAGVNGSVGFAPVRQDFGVFLTRWISNTFVSSTNNASNYWTVRLGRVSGANTPTDIASFDTSADAAGANVNHDTQINAVLDASARYLQVIVSKTATPSNIYVFSSLCYRLIVT